MFIVFYRYHNRPWWYTGTKVYTDDGTDKGTGSPTCRAKAEPGELATNALFVFSTSRYSNAVLPKEGARIWIIFILTWGHFFSLFTEREEGRGERKERNINRLPPVHAQTGDHRCLNRVLNPQPRHVPRLATKATTFLLWMMLQPTEPYQPGQGSGFSLSKNHKWSWSRLFSVYT